MKKYLAVLPFAALAFAAACSDSPIEPTAFQPLAPVGGPSFHLDETGTENNHHNDLKPTLTTATAALQGTQLADGADVTIAWTGQSGNPTTVTHRTYYRYQLDCTGTGCKSVPETDVVLATTSFAVNDLTPGTYVAKVRGLGGPNPITHNNPSTNHGSVWVTVSFSVAKSGPENQTVTFDATKAPSGVTYGDPHVDISNWASASSPITYSSESPSICTVSGVEVAIVAAGTCTIKASAEANAFYNADDETSSFVIAKKGLTVTAVAQNKTYDGAAFTGFTVSYDGFVYNQSASVLGGTLAFEGNAVGAVNAGEYTITPKGLTSGNYAITFANGTLTINKANADISVSGFIGTYDGTAKGASGTATGAAGENLTSLLDLGDSFTNVPGGTANWTFAGDANHNTASGRVAITINKADQTIDFAELSNVMFSVGGTVPLTASASSGLGVALTSNNTAVCTISGTSAVMVKEGTCSITASQAGNGNYNPATAVTRSFTIQAWTLNGFYQPVTMTPQGGTTVYNTAKAGSTVPLKFNVLIGTANQTDVAVVKGLSAQRVTCSAGISDAVDVLSSGGTSLRYDSTAGQFIQNWKTPTTVGCYRAIITTQDGSMIEAFFQLK